VHYLNFYINELLSAHSDVISKLTASVC